MLKVGFNLDLHSQKFVEPVLRVFFAIEQFITVALLRGEAESVEKLAQLGVGSTEFGIKCLILRLIQLSRPQSNFYGFTFSID